MAYKNILIVRLGSIGDVLHCTPVTRALREKYPEAKISWIVADKSKDILLGNSFIDEIIVWNFDEWINILNTNLVAAYLAFLKLKKALQAEQYDMAVDVHAQFIPGLITWKSGASTRVGFSNAKELAPLFYTQMTARNNNLPITKQYLGVLGALGISEYNTDMIMPIAPENHQNAANIWEKYKINVTDKVVVLNASTTWRTKCWPVEHFAQLGDYLLQEAGIKILLTGAKSDIPLVNQIREKMNGHVIDISGNTSLKDIAAVAQKCDLFVSGDTGPLHIAAAVGTPTLSLFGPTDPQVYTPLGEKHSSLLTTVPCRLCRKRKCNKFVCMKQIDPREVYQEAVKLLQRNKGARSSRNEIAYKEVPRKKIPIY